MEKEQKLSDYLMLFVVQHALMWYENCPIFEILGKNMHLTFYFGLYFFAFSSQAYDQKPNDFLSNNSMIPGYVTQAKAIGITYMVKSLPS